MNILYLCDEYPPCQHGGIGSVTQSLARELVSKGHKVSVCGFYPYYRTAAAYEEDFGVQVYRYFYGNWLLLKLSRHKYFGRIVNIEARFNSYTKFLEEFIKNNKIEIVEIPDFNEVFRYTGPRFIKYPNFGIPTIIKIHGSYSFLNHINKGYYFNESIYKKEHCLIQNANKILAISEFTKREVIDIFNYSKDIQIIYNGISLTNNDNYIENPGNNSVIFAGKLTEEKGILNLIMAWEKVIAEIPSARLLLYGKGDKGTIERIKKIVSDKTLGSIEINGYINREILMRIYNSASCAVFPSYAETFGMAPLESMLVGCPTIFTKRTSGEELITNGINGLLVDPDNTDEIADAIKYMLFKRSAAIEMGRKGAQTIKERFNISGIAEAHINVYNSLLKAETN